MQRADWRDWLHCARTGNPWTFATRPGELPIGPLVSPLRFDVTIRAAFMGFYRERRQLFAADPDAFAAQAREHDYYVWFRRVMCPAWQPEVLEDEVRFDAAWA